METFLDRQCAFEDGPFNCTLSFNERVTVFQVMFKQTSLNFLQFLLDVSNLFIMLLKRAHAIVVVRHCIYRGSDTCKFLPQTREASRR